MEGQLERTMRKSKLIFDNDVQEISHRTKVSRRWYLGLFLAITLLNVYGIVHEWGDSNAVINFTINILIFGMVFAWQTLYLLEHEWRQVEQAFNRMAMTNIKAIEEEMDYLSKEAEKRKK